MINKLKNVLKSLFTSNKRPAHYTCFMKEQKLNRIIDKLNIQIERAKLDASDHIECEAEQMVLEDQISDLKNQLTLKNDEIITLNTKLVNCVTVDK